MTEESNKTESQKQNSQFWFLLTFSLLLIVIFVLYLPLRFRSEVSKDDHHHHPEVTTNQMMSDDHGMIAGHAHAEVYHEEGEVKAGPVAYFNVLPAPYLTGRPLIFNFLLSNLPERSPIFAQDLEVEHLKLMHVIGVRSDLKEFFHIHPQPASPGSNLFSVDHVFNLPGRYKIWSEIKKDGVNHIFSHLEINVQGNGPVDNKQVSFGRNVIVGNYQVALDLEEPVAKGHIHKLSFDIHTLAGQKAELEDFLGVKMHLTIIKDDWSQFIHTHPGMKGTKEDRHSFWQSPSAQAHGDEEEPMGGAVPGQAIDFEVTFPTAGLYRAFAEFRPKGLNLPEDEALAAAFWIKVEEKAPATFSARGWLAAVSLILIIILSLAVSRFLKVDE